METQDTKSSHPLAGPRPRPRPGPAGGPRRALGAGAGPERPRAPHARGASRVPAGERAQ